MLNSLCHYGGFVVEIAPLKKSTIKLKKQTGVQVDTGATVETGAQAQAGAEARSAAKAIMAISTAFSGTVTAPNFVGNINPQAWKGFDIKHPNKENHRLRHICLEVAQKQVCTSEVNLMGQILSNCQNTGKD